MSLYLSNVLVLRLVWNTYSFVMVQSFKLWHVYNCYWALKGKEKHERIWSPPKIKIKKIFCLKQVKLKYTPWKHVGGVEVYFHSFLTSVLDAGQWWDLLPGRIALPPPRKTVPLPVEQELPWAPEHVWALWRRENILPPMGIETWFLSLPFLCLITM